MAKAPLKDWYWPLGALDYAHEIHDYFPDEAALLGAITILWNRQEKALRGIFVSLLSSRQRAYAEAIWDRQPTHQARRDLLALALTTVRMTKRKSGILTWVVERTKTLADRRNELIHAEYVVHGRTDQLHARVSSPKSTKPPKHQKVASSDLKVVVNDLVHLLQATEAASLELGSPRLQRLRKSIKQFAEEHGPFPENPHSGSDLPSLRQTHGAEY